jgi:hypothetical protein
MEIEIVIGLCILSCICGFVAAEILQYRKRNKGKIKWIED